MYTPSFLPLLYCLVRKCLSILLEICIVSSTINVMFGDIQEYVYPTDQKINIHCNISIMRFPFDIFVIYHL